MRLVPHDALARLAERGRFDTSRSRDDFERLYEAWLWIGTDP